MADITPGSQIHLKVTKTPTNAAATKTLVRLLSKDEQVSARNRLLSKIRAKGFNPQPRGGRLYSGRLVKQHPVTGEAGEAGTIKATVDVIRDLRSVERFVEVSAA